MGGRDGKFDYTRWQMDSLKSLVYRLKQYYPKASVGGHNDFTNAKACPNFAVPLWWDEVRWMAEEYLDPDDPEAA